MKNKANEGNSPSVCSAVSDPDAYYSLTGSCKGCRRVTWLCRRNRRCSKYAATPKRGYVAKPTGYQSKRVKCRVCGQGEDEGEDNGRNQGSEVRGLVQGEHAAGSPSRSGREVRSEQGCMDGRMGGTGTAEAGNSGCVQCGMVAHVVIANRRM